MTQVTEHPPPATGFVITAIRPATTSLDAVTQPTAPTTAASATNTPAIPDFNFVPDLTATAASTLTTSPITPPADKRAPPAADAPAELSPSLAPSAGAEPPSPVHAPPAPTEPNELSPVTSSDSGGTSPVAPLVCGYDSDTSGSSSGSGSVKTPKKARRVRFAEKVEIRIIPNNQSNQLREAQGEFEDLVDSIGAPLAPPDAPEEIASPLAPLEDPALSLQLAAFEVENIDDLGLMDAEEAERYDDAMQRDLESRVAHLRSKLKRKRGEDASDDSPPPPTDLFGDELPVDDAGGAGEVLLATLAKKPRLINCHM